MTIRLTFLLLALIVLVAPFPADADCLYDLDFISEEFKPYNYSEDGEAKGLAVELLRLIWKRMGVEERPIAFLPWTRAYSMAQEETSIVLFSVLRNKEREHLFKWAGPIATSTTVFITRSDNPVELTAIEDAANLKIGVVRNYASEIILAKYTGLTIHPMKSVQACVKMLESGRVDLISLEKQTFNRAVVSLGLPADSFKVVLPIHVDRSFFAFSKDVPDETVECFQKALDSARKTPEFKNLYNYYM